MRLTVTRLLQSEQLDGYESLKGAGIEIWLVFTMRLILSPSAVQVAEGTFPVSSFPD